MRQFLLSFLICCLFLPAGAQFRVAVIGSSTSAGLGATTYDSSWVGRFNQYYKRSLGIVDTVHNLAVSGTTVYRGMPSSYVPPNGRPLPDTARNVSKAVRLLAGFGRNGAVIVNFPTNGYDNYTIPEVMARLQTIYDSATVAGHRCLITTSQPRSDGAFATSPVKARLAALRDSIINRFGIAGTLNFWDGIYNPADTTILPAYSAGDNVHLNNAGHQELFRRVLAKNIFAANPPLTGDYRSNVSPTGLWSAAASWEVYNGTSWATATAPPDSSSGTVRILAGDSIRVNGATTLDQVIVDTGAVLTFFNIGTPTSFNLTNAPGDDLLVYGRLYISAGGTLTGSGNVALTPSAQFVLRNVGTLGVNTLNEGLARTTGTGTMQGAAFTNNGIFQHVEFTLNLNNGASFINNDSLVILAATDSYISTTSGNGSFVNSPGAVIYRLQPTGITTVLGTVAVSNSGAVKGLGQFILQNIGTNNGIIAPGTSPGVLAINPGFFNGKTPTLQMEISTTGAVAGTNYDQLQLSTVNTLVTNLSGTRLEISNTAGDPVNTVYTLVSSAGTITGSFASVAMPTNFGNLTYNASSVTVEKIAAGPLPLQLLRFDGRTEGDHVQLSWSFAQSPERGRVTVERSADGVFFRELAEVPILAERRDYRYSEIRPGTAARYHYRLRLQGADGRSEYSAVRVLRFREHQLLLSSGPNPVGEMLYLNLAAGPVQILLMDATGKKVRQSILGAGRQAIDLSGIPAGIYILRVEGADGAMEQVSIQRQ